MFRLFAKNSAFSQHFGAGLSNKEKPSAGGWTVSDRHRGLRRRFGPRGGLIGPPRATPAQFSPRGGLIEPHAGLRRRFSPSRGLIGPLRATPAHF